MNAITISDVTKTYSNGFQALKGVSLEVKEGDFFALLGANGAGKSTLIGIISGLVNKSSGTVNVLGNDIDQSPNEAKKNLGLVPQEMNFSIFEKCIDIVVWQAGYFGISRKVAIERSQEIFQKLGLWDKKDSFSRDLSGGMKRRLLIARALIHQPKLLILDEPTAGVDLELRRGMWDYLKDLNQSGVTIILTTHYLEEAEELCKNMAIIDKGEIVKQGQVSELLSTLDRELYIVESTKDLPTNIELIGFEFQKVSDTILEVTVLKEQTLNALVQELSSQKIEIGSIRLKGNRLEELFLGVLQSNKKSFKQ